MAGKSGPASNKVLDLTKGAEKRLTSLHPSRMEKRFMSKMEKKMRAFRLKEELKRLHKRKLGAMRKSTRPMLPK